MAAGARSRGGSNSGGWPVSKKSMTVAALASRLVSAGRFHLCSIVASTEVWSYTMLLTPPGFE